MNRLLACAAALVTAVVAGCGGTACSSNPATPQSSSGSCTLAAGSTATVNVRLCGKCTDTSPGCQAEYRNGDLEIAPTVQQCQEQAGCQIQSGCDIQAPLASCSVTIPAGATAGGNVVVNGQNFGSFNIGSGTSCTL